MQTGALEKGDMETITDFRMFEQEFPEMGDVVTAQVAEIQEFGFSVALLEYGGMLAMIPTSEASKRRPRRGQRLLKEGQIVCCEVLRVDEAKGYIDLSKKRVTPDQIEKCSNSFARAKIVHSVLMVAGARAERSLEEMCRTVSWPLYSNGDPFDVFSKAVGDGDVLDVLALDGTVKDELLTEIRRRLVAPELKMRMDVEAVCFGASGVEGLREALKAAESAVKGVKAAYIGAPSYSLSFCTREESAGCAALNTAVEVMTTVLTTRGGSLKIVEPARVVRAV